MPEDNTHPTRVTRRSLRQSKRLCNKQEMAVNDHKVNEKEASPSASSSSSSESSSSSSSSESSSSRSPSPPPKKGSYKKRRLRKQTSPRAIKEPKKAAKNSLPPPPSPPQPEDDDVPELKPIITEDVEEPEEPKAEESHRTNKDEEETVKDDANDVKEEGEMSDDKEDSMDQAKGDASPPKISQVENDEEKSDTEMKVDNDTSADNDAGAQENDSKKARVSQPESSKPSFRLTKRRISLSVNKEAEQSESQEQQQQRRRRWGSSSKKISNTPSLSISTDALKDLIPDYKPAVPVPALEDLSQEPLEFPSDKEELAFPEKKEEPKKKIVHITKPPEPEKLPETPKEEDVKMQSPPRNPPSCIVHIRNLVRPFTVQQLKNLLVQTGNMVESGFWIDKIKSKCYVTYETEEQAIATRAALHHARWPVSNPKTLIVDFATTDELEFHQKLGDKPVSKPEPPTTYPSQQADFTTERRDVRRTELLDDLRRREERDERRRERERKRERNRDMEHPPPPPPIREWDRDKISQDDQEFKENRSTRTKEKSSDRKERKDKKESKKKQEDDTPAKLLDDLFRKTKTTPCIYWLPLTEEQIRKLAEERKQREVEREKRRKQHQMQLEQAQKEREERREKERKSRGGREKESGRRSRSRSRSPAGRRR